MRKTEQSWRQGSEVSTRVCGIDFCSDFASEAEVLAERERKRGDGVRSTVTIDDDAANDVGENAVAAESVAVSADALQCTFENP